MCPLFCDCFWCFWFNLTICPYCDLGVDDGDDGEDC